MEKKIIYLDNSAQDTASLNSANWSRVASTDQAGIIETLAIIWLGGWALYAIVTSIFAL